MPTISGQTDIVLGSNTTNSSGAAVYLWNGTNSTNSKLYAGNYTVFADATNYVNATTKYYHLIGSLTNTFRNITLNPNSTYIANDVALIQAIIASLGPETATQLNNTYAINVTSNITNPSASISQIQLTYMGGAPLQ